MEAEILFSRGIWEMLNIIAYRVENTNFYGQKFDLWMDAKGCSKKKQTSHNPPLIHI